MFGLILAVLFALFLYSRDVSGPLIFKRSTRFLYRYYLIVAIVLMVFFTITTLTAGVYLLSFLGPIGWLIGLAGGTVKVVVLLTYVVTGYVLEILGSKLLCGSVTLTALGSPPKWNAAKMTVGFVILAIGILFLPVLS